MFLLQLENCYIYKLGKRRISKTDATIGQSYGVSFISAAGNGGGHRATLSVVVGLRCRFHGAVLNKSPADQGDNECEQWSHKRLVREGLFAP